MWRILSGIRLKSLRHTYRLIAALAALAGCGHRPDVDPQFAAAIPEDAAIVAEANLDELRGSPLWRAVPAGLVEPFGEASRILVAEERNEWLVLARGNLARAPGCARAGAPSNGLKYLPITRNNAAQKPGCPPCGSNFRVQ